MTSCFSSQQVKEEFEGQLPKVVGLGVGLRGGEGDDKNDAAWSALG
jgi:hypothetical protein